MGDNRKLVNSIVRRQAAKQKPLSRADQYDLHSVLRRAAERAEKNKRSAEHQALMSELTALEKEMALPSYADPPFACPPDEEAAK